MDPLADARYTVESLKRDVLSQAAAYQGMAYRSDLEALDRAEQALAAAEVLYNQETGALVPEPGESAPVWKR